MKLDAVHAWAIGAGPVLLLAASGLLLLAHVVRAARWSLLFPPTYLPWRFNLLLGLGLGYALNTVVPLRVGEILRIVVVRRRDGLRLSHLAATVLIERITDLLAVAAMLAFLLLYRVEVEGLSWAAPAAMVVVGAALLVGTRLVHRSLRVRQWIWRAAFVFNDQIRVDVADFCWSAAEIVAGRTLLSWRFLGSSVVMWAFYLAAYDVFGLAVGQSPAHVLMAMLGAPQNALVQNVLHGEVGWSGVLLLVFALLPMAGILGYYALRRERRLLFALEALRRRGKSGIGAPVALRKRFEAATTYDRFLASLFSGTDQLVSGFGLEVTGDCIIHRFFNGGSDAITALVEVDGQLLIRKFAAGPAADKLKVQAGWLRAEHGGLPLVRVVAEQTVGDTYTYDMPLITPANDFYEVIHTSPAPHGKALLCRVMEQLTAFHSLMPGRLAEPEAIARYLDVKAVSNARTILEFARSVMPGPVFMLNGREYTFAAWDRLLDPVWLGRQIRDRRIAAIHGDLTIENIIIAPEYPLGFYIIDPNPENVFDSPLIDWAKLMQSLHLGYETLNQGLTCTVSENVIRLSHVRSHAYAELHEVLGAEVQARLGEDALREVYFHEIINYLRLTTYKIRQSPTRGLGFFACTTMLLDGYVERWG